MNYDCMTRASRGSLSSVILPTGATTSTRTNGTWHPTAALGSGLLVGYLMLGSPQLGTRPDDYRDLFTAVTWMTGWAQAKGTDVATQVKADASAAATLMNPAASKTDLTMAAAKSSISTAIVCPYPHSMPGTRP